MHCPIMVYVRIVLTTLLTITCLLGDNSVELTQHPLLKALADNATHALIGAFTGIAFAVQFHDRTSNLLGWFLIFTCFAVSSLIDVDHFIEARSWYLEDATNLQRRPFLHCSSVIFLLLTFYLCTASLNYFKTSLILGELLCAFITHHTRDAVRRGYWFCPFGHTGRVSNIGYIVIVNLTPHLVAYIHSICRSGPLQRFLGQYIKMSDNYRIGSEGYRYMNV
ncbi:transmembrane protein 267 [Ceratitis capitata]|uniref:Transmembrane protein 267 n=1 Tax=Ceratitis capitata TaxID=7213 RepID=W8C3H3_CERCA|nr:transmembrane protein 267 [Ceratitis capitata]CAD7002297.1 unnamed protein product [Ceratitis capitata]